jgi:hypothetical protein
MGKVSIGLRGWRFEESDVFTEDGSFRPLEEMPADARRRLSRLTSLANRPCDACWLEYGEEEIEQANPAEVVYGEPMAEVLLCEDHEPDFVYWFREKGGSNHRGSDDLDDAFYEWCLEGGSAPGEYGSVTHVETDPEDLPDPEAVLEAARENADSADSDAEGDDSEEPTQVEDLDLSREYPT